MRKAKSVKKTDNEACVSPRWRVRYCVCERSHQGCHTPPFLSGKVRDVLQMRSAQTRTNTHEIVSQIQACNHVKPYVLLILIARDEKVLRRGFISFSLSWLSARRVS
jgi:hypothetical protein